MELPTKEDIAALRSFLAACNEVHTATPHNEEIAAFRRLLSFCEAQPSGEAKAKAEAFVNVIYGRGYDLQAKSDRQKIADWLAQIFAAQAQPSADAREIASKWLSWPKTEQDVDELASEIERYAAQAQPSAWQPILDAMRNVPDEMANYLRETSYREGYFSLRPTLKAAADWLERNVAEPTAWQPTGTEDFRLPCDVTVGATIFRKGVALSTLAAAARRWREIAALTECVSCSEGLPRNDCGSSPRPCGHHCNHSWSQDACCYCGAETADDGNFPNTGMTIVRAEAIRRCTHCDAGRNCNGLGACHY